MHKVLQQAIIAFAVLILPLFVPGQGLAARQEGHYRFAFLFAHNHARGLKSLRYAVDDIKKIRKTLVEVSNVPAKNIIFLAGKRATFVRKEMKALLKHFRNIRAAHPTTPPRIELFVYYSGHSRHREFLLGRTSLPFAELEQFLKSSRASLRVVFLDTCQAGLFLRTKGLKRKPPSFAIPTVSVLGLNQTKGQIVMTATNEKNNAHEDEILRSGVFTHYVVLGLRGAADRHKKQGKGDGKVTFNELYRYVYQHSLNHTIASENGPQIVKTFLQVERIGDFTLSDTHRTKSNLMLTKRIKGTFYLWGQKETSPISFRKLHGKSLKLAVIPGKYKLVWRYSGGKTFASRITLSPHTTFYLSSTRGTLLTYRSKGTKGVPPADPKAAAMLWKRQVGVWEGTTSSFFSMGCQGGVMATTGVIRLGGDALWKVRCFGFYNHKLFRIGVGGAALGTEVSFMGEGRRQRGFELTVFLGIGKHWGRFQLQGGMYLAGVALLQDLNQSRAASFFLHGGLYTSAGYRIWKGLSLRVGVEGGMAPISSGSEIKPYWIIGGYGSALWNF